MPAAVADLSRLHVVVPVRALDGGKLRLADVLDERQRTALVTGLLRHTVAVLSTWPEATAVHVVSPDASVLPVARAAGAAALPGGAPAMLLLPVDLPLLDAGALDGLIEAADAAVAAGSGRPVVVIAPADARTGTNALLLSPPDAIQPGFGPGSLERHLRAAAAIEASTQLVVEPALGFDLDTPDDLALLGQTRLDELFALAGAPAPASSAAASGAARWASPRPRPPPPPPGP